MVLTKSIRVWRKYRPRSVLMESKELLDQALLFESNAIAILSPVELDIVRRDCNYSDSVSAYGCLGVLPVSFEQVTLHYLVLVTECQSVGKLQDVEILRITQSAFIPISRRAELELVQEVSKLLSSGRFYFGWPSNGASFDLLACAQKQGKDQPHFFWNRRLLSYLNRFGVEVPKWTLRAMCGHVEISTAYAGDKQAKLCLISRLSCERAGTRFNVRGMNDDGHVANFVETEQAIYVDSNIASFVQVRGLVPLFWDQPGLQTGGGILRIKFSRGPACSHPAFERHFEWCLLHYGPMLCVNLLGTRDQEMMLSNAFKDHLSRLSTAYCAEMLCFDYHRNCHNSGTTVEATLTHKLLPQVESFISPHGFFASNSGQVERLQTGTVRTNCLDCLDRTNSVQAFLGQEVLLQLLSHLNLPLKQSVISRFRQLLSTAWTKSGDNLSQMYAGTRALNLDGHGKTKLQAGARSVQRTIKNNFMDGNKQESIDLLLLSNANSGELGQKAQALLEPTDILAPVPIKKYICDRWSDFTISEKLKVCIGTWNVNGGKLIRSVALRNQSLHDWLLDSPSTTGVAKEHPEEFRTPPDIFAIGFQELVGLTASNIVSASSSNRKEWGTELEKVLSRDTPYELLTAEQLVGVCLYIFIRPHLIPYIRDVAVSSVKTGMSGKAGNKGGIAIRFLLHATSICFVSSHFAAHQTKVIERNQDFADICRKVSFPHGQTLDSHDYVFWCGDLNYRIELPTQIAKDHITNARWSNLMKHDQLKKQKKLRKVFQGYIEGDMTFAPTYKYDIFSDDYDTSEKCRTPAWCDRILWKRKSWVVSQPRQNYSSSRLYALSDQRKGDDQNGVSLQQHDFGLQPNDAEMMCGFEMGTGGKDELVTIGHQWHPGKLLYYNRAELKQSDHRPVVAIIEVDIYRVDSAKRSKVKDEVLLSLGPPNPTVIIQEKEEGTALSVPHLLEALRAYGNVVLVRVTDNATLVTFKHSRSAMAATGLQQVNGVKVEVSLTSPWPPGSSEVADKDGSKKHGKLEKRPTITVLTGMQLIETFAMALDDDEDLMDIGGDGQQPNASDTVEVSTQEPEGAVGEARYVDPFEVLESDPTTGDQELEEPTLSSSSSENDIPANGSSTTSSPPSSSPTKTFQPSLSSAMSLQTSTDPPKSTMHYSQSEPVLSKPQRPVAPVRPARPPRPSQRGATASLNTVSEERTFVVGTPPPPYRPTRPPRPTRAESVCVSNPATSTSVPKAPGPEVNTLHKQTTLNPSTSKPLPGSSSNHSVQQKPPPQLGAAAPPSRPELPKRPKQAPTRPPPPRHN